MKYRLFSPLTLGVVCLVWYLSVFILVPVLSAIYETTIINGKLDFSYYIELFQSDNFFRVLKNTLILALGTIPLCAFVGVTSALCIHAVRVPFKKIWHILMLLPMVVPGTVVVISYINLYGTRGMIGWPLREALGLEFTAYPVTGLGGILFVHMFTQYIYFYLLTSEAIGRIDVSQVEAAKSLGAKPHQIFWQIVFPSFAPALSSATVLTLLGATASFSAPFLMGRDFHVLSTEIFSATQRGEAVLGLAQAICLSIIIIMTLILIRTLESRIFKGANIKGTAKTFEPIDQKVLTRVCTAYLSFLAIIILLPILAIIWISFGKLGAWQGVLHSEYTLENYIIIFSNIRNIQPLFNSMTVSFIGTFGSMVVGVFIAYLVTRMRSRSTYILESVSMLPSLLPSTAMLATLVAFYNVPQVLIFNQTLTGTWWLLPCALMVLRLPIMVRNASASLITMPTSLEEASLSLGASRIRTFFNIVLPYITQGLKFSATITFIFMMGDFASAVFTAVPSNKTIIMSMLGNLDSNKIELTMAYGTLLLIIIFVLVLLFDPLSESQNDSANK